MHKHVLISCENREFTSQTMTPESSVSAGLPVKCAYRSERVKMLILAHDCPQKADILGVLCFQLRKPAAGGLQKGLTGHRQLYFNPIEQQSDLGLKQ